MSVQLTRPLLEQIQAHAEQIYPEECCGLLLGEPSSSGPRVIREAVAVANAAIVPDKADRYEVSPADYVRIDRQARSRGLDIVGFYHSHPDHAAVPSKKDLACAWPRYVYLIVSVRSGRAAESRCWQLADRPRPIFVEVPVAACP